MSRNINSGMDRVAQMVPFSPAGKRFLVGNSSVAGYNDIVQKFGRISRWYSTLSSALAACVASRGDIILIAPGHAETLTSAITCSIAGVSITGLGSGTLVPTLTGNGTIDVLDLTAANITVDNIRFGSPATDAQTSFINVAAAGCTIKNIVGIGSQTSNNVVDCITVASGASDLTIDNVTFYNSVVAVNSFLSFEAAVSRVTVKNCRFFGDVVAGGIIDSATVTHLALENNLVAVAGSSKSAIVLDSNPTGYALNNYFAGTNTTLASNANYGNALRLFNNYVTEETDASKQGALIPAADTD